MAADSYAAGGNTSFFISSDDGELAPLPSVVDRHRGGWAASSFIIATVFGLTVAGGGWSSNLIVFLINEYNIKAIDAAQINNVVSGCINFFPLVGAVLADSVLGCFPVIWISSLISLLGVILLLLSVFVEELKPPACEAQAMCPGPSTSQYAVLYSAIALASIGLGGSRFTLATMGANQFPKLHHQASFFNWFFLSFYAAAFISSTGIVYVEDNLGWGWGFGITAAANALSLALFFIGAPYYCRHTRPRASPFTALLRVAVASLRKRKAIISSQPADYYYGGDDDDDDGDGVKKNEPTNWLRSLNRAALKSEGDILPNGSIGRPWKVCSVEQVEDLKSLVRILPLWLSSIFLATPIGIQLSLTVLQALAADRHLSRTFQFPASSIIVSSFLATLTGIALVNHCVRPKWKRTAGKNLTPLQEIGIGHVFNIASMAVSALVESRRRGSAAAPSRHLMSVLWLVPQMVIVGVGEAFHFPGQVALYYLEFPTCLKSLATAMVAMLIGVAFYLSTALVHFVRSITNWLPNDINHGRLDYVYWAMAVIGVVNFGYFLIISWLYEYKNGEVVNRDQTVSETGD